MSNEKKQTNRTWKLAAGICGALAIGLGAAPALAMQESAGGGDMGAMPGHAGSASELQHASATVASIDKSARTVVLKGEDGEKFSVQVPPEMKNFDKLKVGDKVDLDYYQSLAVAILPPGAKPSMSERSMHQRQTAGGVAGREVTLSAEVVSVDTADNKVTFKGPRGQTKTISVQDPDMQKRLPNLKPGQVVQFTYTEALAANIRPAAK